MRELRYFFNEAAKWDKQPIKTKYWTIMLTPVNSLTVSRPKVVFTDAYHEAVRAYLKPNPGPGFTIGKSNATFVKSMRELMTTYQHGDKAVIFHPKRGKTDELIELLTKWGNKDHIKRPAKRKKAKRPVTRKTTV